MKRICPSCGREVDKLYDGLCYNCYIKLKKKEEKKIEKVYVCKICGRIKYHNRWYNKIDIKDFEYEYTICPKCKRYYKKYNLIIQLRDIDRNIEDEIIKIIKENDDFFKKLEEIDEKNVDIYLYIGKNKIKKYIERLKKYGKIKVTKKLVGYDKSKGKKKYIITILVKKEN
ncbi:MAG: NMD3-related protein [Nanopusillaceae archaeon]